jgi:3',5'-cyclic AMP phosphodiesterase CpdA
VRTIIHLSDLHFGALDERVVPPRLEAVDALAPDLVAVSGDLTQRARRRQFRHARAFLDRLRWPRLVVPGNHDIPLFDLATRFLDPLGRYRRYISDELAPVFADDEMVVVGLNSARGTAFRHGEGRLNEQQVLRATAQLDLAPASAVKIVVTHHPFDLPEGHKEHHLSGRANMAMEWLAAAGADIFLAGHLHVSHVGQTAERYAIAGHSALIVQAGTMSWRARGESSSFNMLRVAGARVEIERHTWDQTRERFARSWAGAFSRSADGWK